MKFAYSRDGAPLLQWGRTAPEQSRGADARALGCACSSNLGSLGDDTLGAMELPKPGAPEPIGSVPILDGIADAIRPVFGTATTPVIIGGGALAALYLLKKLTKKKR